jgi:aspartyl-tRNA(Asn)/glutamyl-tRNA(Gln) amidotransferase subunit B
VYLTEEILAKIKSEMVPTPMDNFQYLKDNYDLTQAEIEVLVESQIVIDILKGCDELKIDKRESALLLINKIIPEWDTYDLTRLSREAIIKRMQSFIAVFQNNKVSKSMAYQNLFEHIWKDLDKTIEEVAMANNLILSHDTDALGALVQEIITANPDKVNAYNKGKKGLIGFFMGEGMKKSKGKYDPKTLNKAFMEKLSN